MLAFLHAVAGALLCRIMQGGRPRHGDILEY